MSNDKPTLRTADQIAAEKFALEILAHPETAKIWAALRETLRGDPAMQKPNGAATLERSLLLWTSFLAIREFGGDAKRPKILWVVENSAHEWDGIGFLGTGAAGDNPDNIYRGAFVEGTSRYELQGRRPENPAVQFSIELTHGSPGHFALAPQSAKTPDLGDQIAVLRDVDIAYAPDGQFCVTFDAAPANGRKNHIQLREGMHSINFRDSLADWNQRPHYLELRRTRGPAGPELTTADMIRNTLAHMPEFVLFWARFNKAWLGAPKVNTLAPAVPRDGGWGFLAGGHFDLADDEAMIVSTLAGGAKYTGCQITNPWMIADDGAAAITSRNPAQVTADAQGGVTYVISERDPGAPNWIGTGGLAQGTLLLRWQQTTANTDAASLIRDFKIVKVSDVQEFLSNDTKWVSAAGRAAELRRRKAEYAQRLDY